jgi:hypothetical protein
MPHSGLGTGNDAVTLDAFETLRNESTKYDLMRAGLAHGHTLRSPQRRKLTDFILHGSP